MNAINANTQFANRDMFECVFIDYSTKKPFLSTDYANVSTVELTGEQSYAYGGHGHVKKIPFYGEKGGTLTIETQVQTFKMYQFLTGGELTNTLDFVRREVVTSTADSELNVKGTPVEGTIEIFTVDDDCGTPITGTFTAAAATEPATGAVITGGADEITANTQYVVYYGVAVEGIQAINISSTTFPKSFIFYGETYDTLETGDTVSFYFKAYKCAPQPNCTFSFSNSGDPGTLSLVCDLMEDSDHNFVSMAIANTIQ